MPKLKTHKGTAKRIKRGLPDDLVGPAWSGASRDGTGAGVGPATALGRGGRFRDGAGPGLHGGAHPALRRARQGLQGPL